MTPEKKPKATEPEGLTLLKHLLSSIRGYTPRPSTDRPPCPKCVAQVEAQSGNGCVVFTPRCPWGLCDGTWDYAIKPRSA